MRVTDPARGLRIVSGMMVAASVAAALLCARPATGGGPATPSDPLRSTYFRQHIQPILETRCLSCHQAGSTVSRLDLSTRAAALRGGERGPALVPGNPEASLLIQLVTHRKQPFMPMGGERLPQAEIDRLSRWISAGARYPEDESDPLSREDARRAAGRKLFVERVKPLFESTCLKCHSTETRASGLDLSNRAAMLDGGENGAVVAPGHALTSRLYQAVAHEIEPHMPFRSLRLKPESIDALARWIDAGAPFEGTLKASSGPIPTGHWAFQPPVRPSPPLADTPGWIRNPIDAFVAAGHRQRGLRPVNSASKRVLLRRLFLDLTGLPPTPEETAAFLADNSDEAYERVVDRLLGSPRYGERWGRHWMDIWRYSDWYGWKKNKQVRYSHRHLWRWRDWIVESVNEDKGYHRMVLEMLAGDELAPGDPEVVRATGYLARSWYRFNRNVWLQETVEYAGASFLGLTVKCARCHDHKYDPILQTDYYRLRAVFEPHQIRMDRVSGQPDLKKDGLTRAYDADAGAQTYRFLRGNEASPDEDRPLSPGVPRLFGQAILKVEPIRLPLEVSYPAVRAFVHEDLIQAARNNIRQAESEVAEAAAALAEVEGSKRPLAPAPPGVGEDAATPEAPGQTEEEAAAALRQARNRVALAHKRLRAARAHLPALEARIEADRASNGLIPGGDAEALAAAALRQERKARILKAEAEVLEARQELSEALLNPNPKPKSAKAPQTGQREDPPEKAEKFADEKRIAKAQKKLEAAVQSLKGPTETYTAVGPGYPRTSTGRRLALARWIASPGNPLTARVAVNHLWLRHFGEGLVSTADNFGSSGRPPSHPELLDWLAVEFMESGWSMKHLHRLMVTSNTYRMQSAVPRDHPGRGKDPDNLHLWRRNPRRMESEVVRDSLLYLAGRLDSTMGGPEIAAGKAGELPRRSLYFQHTPDTQAAFLKVWDAPSPNECFRRNESITPHQALSLSNSPVSLSMSRILARSLSAGVGQAEGRQGRFVDRAFDAILGRAPSNRERMEARKFLLAQAGTYKGAADLEAFDAGVRNEKVPPSADPLLRARESLVHVLFNHNEFVTIR